MEIKSKTIDYIDDYGQLQQATTDGTSKGLDGFRAPNWSIINENGPYDFLTYLGEDGQLWETKIYVNESTGMTWRFESKHPGQADGNTGPFLYRGSNDTIWEVTELLFEPRNDSDWDIIFVSVQR